MTPGAVQAVVVVPSQVLAQGPAPPQAVRAPTGAPLTGEHVPPFPLTLQASHCPVHEVAQQTPSTHEPAAQSLEATHAAPSARPSAGSYT